MRKQLFIFCLLFVGALSYSSPLMGAAFDARSVGRVSRCPSLRGGHSDFPSSLHTVMAGTASQPPSKEDAQQQRSYIQQLSSGAKARSAIPGLEAPEVEDQTPRIPLSSTSKVLIVGTSRGIGLEFVKQVLGKGASVVATHRGSVPDSLQDLQKEVGEEKLSFLQMDVGSEASIQEAADKYSKSSSFAPLTHIIHNAGIYGPRVSLDGKSRYGRPAGPPVSAKEMMEVFQVNAVGPLMVAQKFLPHLCQPTSSKDTPVIGILTSKVGSVDDNTSGGAYAYRASKAALNVLAKSLMCDTVGAANVVLLHPGYVRTDMTDGQGLIDADQSVEGMLRAIEATDGDKEFRFVDYKACIIPW